MKGCESLQCLAHVLPTPVARSLALLPPSSSASQSNGDQLLCCGGLKSGHASSCPPIRSSDVVWFFFLSLLSSVAFQLACSCLHTIIIKNFSSHPSSPFVQQNYILCKYLITWTNTTILTLSLGPKGTGGELSQVLGVGQCSIFCQLYLK